MKYTLSAMVIATAFSITAPAGNRIVSDLADFNNYVMSHRYRVVQLGMALKKRFPERYGHLSDQLMYEFLNIHDLSKTEEKNKKDLFVFYGRERTSLISGEKKKLEHTVNSINDYDYQVTQEFFAKHGIIDFELYYEIEKIADLVDRAKDPVAAEDFGRTMRLASQIFKEPLAIHGALFLERNYKHIIQGADFFSYQQKFHPRCRKVF